MRRTDPHIKIVELSRNFGKERALSRGLAYATGDAVIRLDADLQDPPDLIPEMVQKWRQGYDMVVAIRSDRAKRHAAQADLRQPVLPRLPSAGGGSDAGERR